MTFLKNLKRWFFANLIWLKKALPVWQALGAVVFIGLLVNFLPSEQKDQVRYWGLLLELLGIFTVASALRGKRELFKRPSFSKHIQKWLGEYPGWKPTTQTTVLSLASFSITAMGATIFTSHNPTDDTLEVRVKAVEANLKIISSQIEGAIKNIGIESQTREKALVDERQMRESELAKINKQLDTLAVDGINFEVTGIFWLFIGIILATIPEEIVNLYNYLL